jgi:hypothetical protein
VFGSSTSEGEVSDGVVSVFGDTRVTGPVGDSVVAVLGDLYVNSQIDGQAVAILGDVELGPNAEVAGETVVVGGSLKRAASAITHGGVEQVLGGHFGGMDWLRPWIKHCLLLLRPLAIAPGLGWAWGLAFGFLALYVLFALMFQGAMEKCVSTFEQQPGRTLLASLLALLLSPVMIMLLIATVIGMVLVPFVGLALFCAGLFGKAAVLALIGKRITRPFGNETLAHPAFGVLIGGLLMLLVYLIPVVGFIVYKLLGIIGLGVVVYTLILQSRSADRKAAEQAAAASMPAGGAEPAHRADAAGAAAFATGATAFSAHAGTGASADAGVGTGAHAGAGTGAGPGTGAGASTGAGVGASAGAGAGLGAAPRADSDKILVDITTLPRAGFWVRMGALLIDVILVGVASSLLHGIGDVMLLLLATYGAILWKLKGTTVGGIVFNLKVGRLDGRPMDWATSIVRALGCFLSMVIVGLGFIWIVFDDERQAWHDKIAGTVVVRAPKGVSLV